MKLSKFLEQAQILTTSYALEFYNENKENKSKVIYVSQEYISIEVKKEELKGWTLIRTQKINKIENSG